MILERHPVIDIDVVLQLAAIADPGSIIDEDVLAYIAIPADNGMLTDMSVRPYAGTRTNLRAAIHHGTLMDEDIRHIPLIDRLP